MLGCRCDYGVRRLSPIWPLVSYSSCFPHTFAIHGPDLAHTLLHGLSRMDIRQIVLSVLIVLLSGCSSTGDQLRSSGYPPAYVNGFEAGCSSGRNAAGLGGKFSKDVPRFMNDKLYADGWTDGLNQCQRQASTGYGDEDRWDLIWRERNQDREHRIDQERGKAFR